MERANKTHSIARVREWWHHRSSLNSMDTSREQYDRTETYGTARTAVKDAQRDRFTVSDRISVLRNDGWRLKDLTDAKCTLNA